MTPPARRAQQSLPRLPPAEGRKLTESERFEQLGLARLASQRPIPPSPTKRDHDPRSTTGESTDRTGNDDPTDHHDPTDPDEPNDPISAVTMSDDKDDTSPNGVPGLKAH